MPLQHLLNGWPAQGSQSEGPKSSFSAGLQGTRLLGPALPGVLAQPPFPPTELPKNQSRRPKHPCPLPHLAPSTKPRQAEKGLLSGCGQQGGRGSAMLCIGSEGWSRPHPHPLDDAPRTLPVSDFLTPPHLPLAQPPLQAGAFWFTAAPASCAASLGFAHDFTYLGPCPSPWLTGAPKLSHTPHAAGQPCAPLGSRTSF